MPSQPVRLYQSDVNRRVQKQWTALLTHNEVKAQQHVKTNHAEERNLCFFKHCMKKSAKTMNGIINLR